MNLRSKISETAYALWQEAGCPENKSLDFWLLAEKKHKLLQTFENAHKGSIVTSSYFNEFGNLVSITTYYW